MAERRELARRLIESVTLRKIDDGSRSLIESRSNGVLSYAKSDRRRKRLDADYEGNKFRGSDRLAAGTIQPPNGEEIGPRA